MTLQLLSVYVGHHIGLAMAQVGKNLFFFFSWFITAVSL